MHLLSNSKSKVIKMPHRPVMSCPRVGLTLKRYDEHKEKEFWMADYRFLTYPLFQAKMKDFVILSLIKEGKTPHQIADLTAARIPKIDDMVASYKKGKMLAETTKKTIKEHHKESMKSADWGLVYGMHQVLVSKSE